jgi:hypothetical protein
MLDPDLTASSEGPTPCESELGHAVHAEMKCADSVRLQYAEIDTILTSVRVRVSSRPPAADDPTKSDLKRTGKRNASRLRSSFMKFGKLKVPMETRTDFVIRVQPDSLTRSGHGSICGQIWCEVGTLAFPESHWSDFPVVVVSWWLEAVVGIFDGRIRNADVNFMGGPYVVHLAAKRRDSWKGQFLERALGRTKMIQQFDFSQSPFVSSLLNCSGELLHECSAKGWESTDVDSVISKRERLIQYVGKDR